MKYLLDTDTCIAILRGWPGAIRQVSKHSPDDLAISSITRYELLYGVQRCDSRRRAKEREKVAQFLAMVHEIAFTGHTSSRAAELRHKLESQGQAIGPLDTLIAATALDADLILVSGNLREFDRVSDLRTENWIIDDSP